MYDLYLPNNAPKLEFTARKFILRQMNGGYQPQYFRPLATTGHTRVINEMSMAWHERGDRYSFASNAHSFLSPQAVAGAQVMVPNGWDTPRFMVYLEIAENIPTCDSVICYGIIGFTDHSELSYGNKLDPKTHIHLNTIMKYMEKPVIHRNGARSVSMKLVGSANVMVNPIELLGKSGFSKPDVEFSSLRPYDVALSMGVHDLIAGGYIADRKDVLNTTNVLCNVNKVALADCNNQIASNYVGKVIESYRDAVSYAKNDPHLDIDSPTALAGQAAAYLGDTLMISNVGFIEKLTRMFNYGDKPFIYLRDLTQLFPEIDRIGEIYMNPPHARNNYQYKNTEVFSGSSPETVTSYSLANTIPAIMINSGLIDIGFTVTNRTMNGMWVFNIAADPISGSHARANNPDIEIGDLISSFFKRLELELFNSISHGGNVDLTATVFCDIHGDIRIDLSMSGGPMTTSVFPAFLNSYYSPLLSTDSRRAMAIAGDFATLRDTCGVGYDTSVLEKTTNFRFSDLV